jgi:probable rRNA maturation factor
MGADVFGADEQADVEVDLASLVDLATKALDAEGVRAPAEVSLLLVDEGAMAALNKQFMGKDGPTDVLSFPIEDEPGSKGRNPDSGTTGPISQDDEITDLEILLGDIVICPAVAQRNAADHEVTLEQELGLLVVHGVLHLLGWDHVVDAEAERMEAREQVLLARFATPGTL